MNWHELAIGIISLLTGIAGKTGADQMRGLAAAHRKEQTLMAALQEMNIRLARIEAKQHAAAATDEELKGIRTDLKSALDRLVDYVLAARRGDEPEKKQ